MEEVKINDKKVWLQIEAHILDTDRTIKLTSGVSIPVDINEDHVEVLNKLFKDIRGFIKQAQNDIAMENGGEDVLGL